MHSARTTLAKQSGFSYKLIVLTSLSSVLFFFAGQFARANIARCYIRPTQSHRNGLLRTTLLGRRKSNGKGIHWKIKCVYHKIVSFEPSTQHWLDQTARISRQLRGSKDIFELYFGVKFYAADPTKLIEEITR